MDFRLRRCSPAKSTLLREYLSPSAPWLKFRELSFPDYLASFPATAVNAGMLVGHNTLRLMVMGMDQRAPTSGELEHDVRVAGRRPAVPARSAFHRVYSPRRDPMRRQTK